MTGILVTRGERPGPCGCCRGPGCHRHPVCVPGPPLAGRCGRSRWAGRGRAMAAAGRVYGAWGWGSWASAALAHAGGGGPSAEPRRRPQSRPRPRPRRARAGGAPRHGELASAGRPRAPQRVLRDAGPVS